MMAKMSSSAAIAWLRNPHIVHSNTERDHNGAAPLSRKRSLTPTERIQRLSDIIQSFLARRNEEGRARMLLEPAQAPQNHAN